MMLLLLFCLGAHIIYLNCRKQREEAAAKRAAEIQVLFQMPTRQRCGDQPFLPSYKIQVTFYPPPRMFIFDFLGGISYFFLNEHFIFLRPVFQICVILSNSFSRPATSFFSDKLEGLEQMANIFVVVNAKISS